MEPRQTLKIREARKRDALELVRLRRETIAEERWFISRSDEVAFDVDAESEHIAWAAEIPNGGLWVARLDRKVVGLLQLEPPPFLRTRHVVKLEVLVAESYRGRGVGRGLLEHGLQWVREHPVVCKIGLNVFADNERALHLYESLGFVEEGRRVREYRMEDGSWRDDILLCWYAGQ